MEKRKAGHDPQMKQYCGNHRRNDKLFFQTVTIVSLFPYFLAFIGPLEAMDVNDDDNRLQVLDHAAGSYDSICVLTLGGRLITVYNSVIRECEWAAKDIVLVFKRSNSTDKAKKTLADAAERIQDVYKAMWPGEELNLKLSKHDPDAPPHLQDIWFVQKTIPTSAVFAVMVYFMTYKYFTDADRSAACHGFSDLLRSLLQTTGELEVEHVLCGQGGEAQSMTVDTAGRVMISDFFTRVGWDFAKELWIRDRKNDKKEWVTAGLSYSDRSRVLLSEVVTFVLDPHNAGAFRELAVPCVLGLLTEIACLVDENVLGMSSQILGINRKAAFAIWNLYSNFEL